MGLARARDPLVGPDLHTNGGAIESLAAEQAWDRAAGEGEIPLARRLLLGVFKSRNGNEVAHGAAILTDALHSPRSAPLLVRAVGLQM